MIDYLFTKTPLKLMTEGLWRDEAFSYLLSSMTLGDIVIKTAQDFNPPLYYIVLHYWMKLFGTSEVALRSLSVTFFVLSVYVVYHFIKKLTTHQAFLPLYLLFYVLNPFLLYYAFETRMYAMVVFFTVLSFYFFYTKQHSKLVLVNCIGIFVHYFFACVIATQAIYQYFWTDKKRIRKASYYFVIIPFMVFLPWLVYILPTFLTSTSSFWIQKTKLNNFVTSLTTLFTGYEGTYYNFYNSMQFVLSLGLFVLVIGFFLKHKKDANAHLLALWSFLFYFIAMAISTVKPIFTPRYLIFAASGFTMLLVYIADTMPQKLRFIFLVVMLFIMVHFWSLQLPARLRGGERQTLLEIKSIASDDDLLYVTDPLLFFTASYYFDQDRVYIYGRFAREIPHYIGTVVIMDDRYTDKLPFYPQKTFIFNSSDDYQIQSTF